MSYYRRKNKKDQLIRFKNQPTATHFDGMRLRLVRRVVIKYIFESVPRSQQLGSIRHPQRPAGQIVGPMDRFVASLRKVVGILITRSGTVIGCRSLFGDVGGDDPMNVVAGIRVQDPVRESGASEIGIRFTRRITLDLVGTMESSRPRVS